MALRFVFQAQGRGGSLFLRSVLGEVSTLGAAPSQTQPLSRMNQRNFTSLLQSQTPQPMPTSRLAPRTSFFHSSSLLSMDIEEAEVEEVDFLDESEAVVIQQYGVTPQTFVHKKENLMTFEELYSNLKDFLTNEDYLHFKVKKVAVYHLFNKAQVRMDTLVTSTNSTKTQPLTPTISKCQTSSIFLIFLIPSHSFSSSSPKKTSKKLSKS